MYVAISSASVAQASLAFLSTFSSPPEPRTMSSGVLASASACPTASWANPTIAPIGLPPPCSSPRRASTRSAWVRVSRRCFSSAVR